jgi:hypothetical protein
VSETPELTAKRSRLAAVEDELARLQAQHDLAMSAFQFDEANALQRQIEALEDERRVVASALPPIKPAAEPPLGVVPVLTRPRQMRRRRMG